jgi:Holliday junction resolvase RusA-like endonuclease
MNMASIEFTVLGEPVGKGRPRASMVCGHAVMYTPKKTYSYEQEVKQAFQAVAEKQKWVCSDKPLQVTIIANFPLLSTDYKKDGTLTKNGGRKIDQKIMPTKKPDCDNIIKVILDALNMLAYFDDKQVISCTIVKLYGKKPNVIVKIQEIE